MLRVGLIGFGYWGPNLARNFAGCADCCLSAIADLNPEKRKRAGQLYPSAKILSSSEEIINSPDIDCVIIATPILTHYELAKKALLRGKHVLVEKSLTASLNQAEELRDIAASRKKVLMVDHTFLYTGAVKKIKQLIDSGDIGDVCYIDSTRINLGQIKNDISVIWDLMAHDVAIILHLLKSKPSGVSATGISRVGSAVENIAYMTLHFKPGLIAHATASWISPVKVRKTFIGGSKKMVVYDDVEPTEKVKIYDSGYSIRNLSEKEKMMVDYRTGDIFVPKVDTREALACMCEDFVAAVLAAKKPVSDITLAVEVVKILEATMRSAKAKGKEVIL